jgi:hypothetical protein
MVFIGDIHRGATMKLLYAAGLSALMLVPTSQVTAQDRQPSNPNNPLATIQLDPSKCHYVFGVIVCPLETPQGTVTLNIDPKDLPSLQRMIQ